MRSPSDLNNFRDVLKALDSLLASLRPVHAPNENYLWWDDKDVQCLSRLAGRTRSFLFDACKGVSKVYPSTFSKLDHLHRLDELVAEFYGVRPIDCELILGEFPDGRHNPEMCERHSQFASRLRRILNWGAKYIDAGDPKLPGPATSASIENGKESEPEQEKEPVQIDNKMLC